MADTPRLVLIPIYPASDPDLWGYAFDAEHSGQEPAAWAWVRAGYQIEPEPGTKRFVVREPGRESTRFAHELYHESRNDSAMPIDLDPEPN
jgi:hypothetical protein